MTKEEAWNVIQCADVHMVDCDDYEADDYLAQARSKVAKAHLQMAKMLFKYHEYDAAGFNANEAIRIVEGN
jgi:hypothetical protein